MIDGNALRIVRQKDGCTSTALAEKVGISLSYLGDIEAGRRTLKRNPELVSKLADALNVPRSMIEYHPAEAAS